MNTQNRCVYLKIKMASESGQIGITGNRFTLLFETAITATTKTK